MATFRDLLLVLGGAVLGAGAAWALASGPSTDAPPPEAAPTPTGDRAPVHTRAAPATCEAERSALQKSLKFQEMLYAGLRDEHFGRPIAWPADTPDQYSKSGFEALVREVMASCQTGTRLRGVECAEPPCIAAFVAEPEAAMFDPYSRITECPSWNEAFGASVTMNSTSVDCGDGTSESLVMLSPYWEEIAAGEASENYQKRIGGRQKTIKDTWECGGGR